MMMRFWLTKTVTSGNASSVTRFANLPEVYLLYRMHPSSISRIHSDIQAYNSAKTSQRMISRILGYEVPFEICYDIRLGRFETADDAVQTVRVIRSLYDTFMAKESLSIPEKRAIRRDAAQRLVSLAWRWLHKARMRWEFLALAFRLNLLIVVKTIGSKAVRKAWRLIARPSQQRVRR